MRDGIEQRSVYDRKRGEEKVCTGGRGVNCGEGGNKRGSIPAKTREGITEWAREKVRRARRTGPDSGRAIEQVKRMEFA